MTGAEFNTEVLSFLDTDAARRGISAFRDSFKRAAIADLGRYIDEFNVGQLTFADDEETPFDTDSAEAVAEFMKSKITRNVDRDLQLSQAHWGDYLNLRRRMFVRLKEDRNPELKPWIGKPYTVILNLRKGKLPQPIIGNVWFTVKEYQGEPDACALVALERGVGIEVLDADTSKIRITVEAEQTALLMLGKEYFWDVQVEDTDHRPVFPLWGKMWGRQPLPLGRPATGIATIMILGTTPYTDSRDPFTTIEGVTVSLIP